VQTRQAKLSVALAPLADGHAREPHPLGDGSIRLTCPAGQHAARSSGTGIGNGQEPAIAAPPPR